MRKGIVLAGGSGTRLHPVTRAMSKQLLPVYDKPMVYYPVATLLLGGIRDILIISTPTDLPRFAELLGDGSQWGVHISYAEQPKPEGLAQAFLIGQDFLAGDPAALVLGDNIFHGQTLRLAMQEAAGRTDAATVFGSRVHDPERYGVAEVADDGRVIGIEEKPQHPKSNIAVVGLYFYPGDVSERAAALRPSPRGELEITDLNATYLADERLRLQMFGRGMVWLDTGTFDSLHEASSYVATITHRTGYMVMCPDEIAWRLGFIETDQLLRQAHASGKSPYGEYLRRIAREPRHA